MQLIRIKDVSKRFCIPISTIWYWVKQENFPQPIKLGSRFIAWCEDDLNTWLEAKQQNISIDWKKERRGSSNESKNFK